MEELVEQALRSAALWDEVKDRLTDSALKLSQGQQQRLVIARAIALEPRVLLLDEPASSLDPISTLRIEELIYELKHSYTIIIVTHNMQQAARVSDYTAFMNEGRLVEFGLTENVFTSRKTRDRRLHYRALWLTPRQGFMDRLKPQRLHISAQFNAELVGVRNDLMTMGGLVESQIERAIDATWTAIHRLLRKRSISILRSIRSSDPSTNSAPVFLF